MKRHSAERFLFLGLMGAILSVAAELLGGYAPAEDSSSALHLLLSALDHISVARIGLCSSIGAIGILMQYLGYYGIYRTFDRQRHTVGRLYLWGNWGYTLIGTIIHVLCCVLMYLMKDCPPAARPAQMTEFIVWFMLPVFVPFFAAYLGTCVIMFREIAGGFTLFPRSFCLLNPLTGKLVFGLMGWLLPNTPLRNGLCFANMGITSLVIFAFCLQFLRRSKPACRT